ncbi:hypothetical protein DFP73DRAFT_632654 [Morchella snyderi]|nr:hypothetical protein DFP73DRAFT_632654 [Morchella snyderi]
MSTWADVAASGPPQSAEEVRESNLWRHDNHMLTSVRPRANPVDEVIPVDSSVSSLVDVDSGVSVVESNFLEKEIQTETQARRIALEEATKAAAEEEKKAAQKKPSKRTTSSSSSSSSITTQFQNPIVLANAITVAAVSAALGIFGFRKHQAGQLSMKVLGLGAAFAAAFGTADYFVSSYLFKKYPPKK